MARFVKMELQLATVQTARGAVPVQPLGHAQTASVLPPVVVTICSTTNAVVRPNKQAVPSCLAMSVPYSTRGAMRPMCVKMGTSSSSCKAGDSDPNLGANCAGSASGSSQLPFAEEPTTDIDSGLRVFAATQQTSGSGWIGSGCQCYELELFSAQDYDPKVATNLNQSGYSDEPSFCAENGTGCLLWPSGKTLTVMVSNEGGMGTDTQPFTAEVRTALFDFAVPGGGFGDFNGCSGAWPGVYVKNGGPCSASDDTENCNIFGGFKYAGSDLAAGGGPVFCADIGSAYPEAVEACKWMFGASGSYSLNPWPAASDRGIGNPFIRKIRSVTCPPLCGNGPTAQPSIAPKVSA
eukprot:CAMPEP_0115063772 /NCGR_PEP_ID=MMETSP0227-20121206/9294_1 /TAXON_ID=89957 /ORGANISM="Polarella glacialis, Strain CCMP 1383" /LENGTH=349 /DNA_ID=CAMNT_0002449313 /DNA_START=98 /DNA_END=1147 /DNA_ORIENTATION=-